MPRKNSQRTGNPHPDSTPAPAPTPAPTPGQIVGPLADWFASSARPLPWRTTPRDPYASLVSEFMLQQTQVSRVLERFAPFMERFPDIHTLARADQADILAKWSGLGYYRRAHHLHAAAKEIVARFHGVIPSDPAQLLSLPGLGRYTAGSIASIVFEKPAPIVDGNVSRVLLRLHGRELSAAEAAEWAWERAGELVDHAADQPRTVALLNEGLMELGALVCTPRAPRCDDCPVAGVCKARQEGTQLDIPTPKKPARRSSIRCDCIVVRDRLGRWLVEQRPATGLWAGLWQVPTIDSTEPAPPTFAKLRTQLGVPAPQSSLKPSSFPFQTTHRDVIFTVFRPPPIGNEAALAALTVPATHTAVRRRWISQDEFDSVGLSNPQKQILSAQARPPQG